MTLNRFGGFWTQDKLDVLKQYLGFYSLAMSKQAWCERIYIDAFAGTGRCMIRNSEGGETIIDGSAKIALDCAPGFHKYRFIEAKKKHRDELEQLIASHPNGTKATISKHTAEDMLPMLLLALNWKKTRGVLFLDPFGLQCSYQLLQQISGTQALDVFFLVSLSGLYRQAAVNEKGIDAGKAAKLSAFLGTDEWRTAIYKRAPQEDFFNEPEVTRERGSEAILQFTTERLRGVFPYVGDPTIMYGRTNAPMFALYFAVSNPSANAIQLAQKVSNEILTKLQS